MQILERKNMKRSHEEIVYTRWIIQKILSILR